MASMAVDGGIGGDICATSHHAGMPGLEGGKDIMRPCDRDQFNSGEFVDNRHAEFACCAEDNSYSFVFLFRHVTSHCVDRIVASSPIPSGFHDVARAAVARMR